MNRELKKRKKRFWVLCMAAVLLLYNILPMTAYAAEYKMKNTYVESYDLSAGGSIVPGEVLYMQYGAYDYKYSTIEYHDENGNILMTDTLDTDAQTFDGETYYKGIVKTYSAAGGDASKEALFKEWKIPSIYTSGGYATEVMLQAVMYIQSNIHYNLNADETNAAMNPTTYLEGVGVASLESASKTGYNFEGWYSEPAFTTKVTSIPATQTGTVDLYPKFSLATYNINYELDGGTNDTSNPTGYTYGSGVMLADASKTGYTFDGWYSDAAFTTRVTEISATDMGNKTLYAKFTLNASTSTPTPTPNPGVTPTPNPGVTTTPTPAPAATVTTAPSATAAPMVKDDVPKTGDGMQGILLFGAMLLSGIGLVIVGYRKSFTDEKQG